MTLTRRIVDTDEAIRALEKSRLELVIARRKMVEAREAWRVEHWPPKCVAISSSDGRHSVSVFDQSIGDMTEDRGVFYHVDCLGEPIKSWPFFTMRDAVWHLIDNKKLTSVVEDHEGGAEC